MDDAENTLSSCFGDRTFAAAATRVRTSEQFAVRLKNSRLIILPVQAVAEDIFI